MAVTRDELLADIEDLEEMIERLKDKHAAALRQLAELDAAVPVKG
jgi:hypothetical protein